MTSCMDFFEYPRWQTMAKFDLISRTNRAMRKALKEVIMVLSISPFEAKNGNSL